MVRPRSAADVAACVQYAAEKHIPVHARGAGSGVAGESLGPGLVVDFSGYLRRVVRIRRGHGPRAAGRGPRAAQRPACGRGAASSAPIRPPAPSPPSAA